MSRPPRTRRAPDGFEWADDADGELAPTRDADAVCLDLTCCGEQVARIGLTLADDELFVRVFGHGERGDAADGTMVMARIRCGSCFLDLRLTEKIRPQMTALRAAHRAGLQPRLSSMDARNFR